MFHKENERALSLFYYFVKQELNQQPSKKTILKVRYSSFIYKASQEQPCQKPARKRVPLCINYRESVRRSRTSVVVK